MVEPQAILQQHNQTILTKPGVVHRHLILRLRLRRYAQQHARREARRQPDQHVRVARLCVGEQLGRDGRAL